jgi:LacI family gluconate utilization system Gnt-I transcriptional repressor
MSPAPPPRKRRAPPDSVRMEDVARAAGVSAITVSRALNAPDKLSPATLRAVRAAIERLRYVPNLTAGSLASNRSRTVAVIVPTVNSSIFSDTIDGLAQALASHRYQLLLGQTNYRLEEESALVQAFLGRRVDGLVLTGVHHARGVRSHPRGGNLGPERPADPPPGRLLEPRRRVCRRALPAGQGPHAPGLHRRNGRSIDRPTAGISRSGA